ncbi:MAG: EAL domain-containing protein [Pseudomonadota bacterium]
MSDLISGQDGFFGSLLDRLEDPIFVKDRASRWLYSNRAFEALVGHSDLIGKTDSDLFPEEQYAEFYAGDRFVLEHNRSLTQEESIGPDTWALVKKTPILLPDGNPGILGIIIDVTEYRSMRIEVESLRLARRQALHDPLTDLPNRRHLEEHFLELLTARKSRGSACLMHLDLDGFKAINDQQGHAAGDAILVAVARKIEALLATDMFAARIGGDEFVILCEEFDSPETARDWGNALIETMREPILFKGQELSVGASLGIATARDVNFELDALLNAADIALYMAKDNGRNQVRLYTPQIGKRLKSEKLEKGRALSGLSTGEFLAFYQPQFDLLTGALVGVEALARWNHPKYGVLSPQDFLRFFSAEQNLDQLDIAVLDRVLSDASALRNAGHAIDRFAVNVSTNLIAREDLVEVISARIPKDFTLALEVPETMPLEDLDTETRHRLDSIRDLGCAIDIDDFGRSQASLLGLVSLRPDRIKIDKSLILPMVEMPTDQVLVQCVLQLAQVLELDVFAEGIETRAHLDALRALGCKMGQGYHLAEPMALDDLGQYLAQLAERGMKVAV